MKKAFPIFLIMLMLFTMIPCAAFAEDGTTFEDEIIVNPGDDPDTPSDPVDPEPSDPVDPDTRDEEEIYNPGPSTNRQTNEDVEVVKSGRKATGTKKTTVKETAPSVNESLNSSVANASTKTKTTTTTTSNTTTQSNTTPTQGTTTTTVTSANRTSLAALDTTQTADTKTQVGETSPAPKTSDGRNFIPLIAMLAAFLGIGEVFILRKRFN